MYMYMHVKVVDRCIVERGVWVVVIKPGLVGRERELSGLLDVIRAEFKSKQSTLPPHYLHT